MLTPKKNKFISFILGKGFYAVLAFCIAGAGIAAWTSVNNTIGSLSSGSSSSDIQYSQSETPVGGEVSNLPRTSNTENSKSSESSQVSQYSAPEVQNSENSVPFVPSQTAPVYTLPVSGEIITCFSNGELVKNYTLNEWRTHNGIDIKSAVGEKVYSCAAGTVSRVFNDTLWGNAVEITHSDGIVSRYYGLSDNICVAEGETVVGGALIGYVGDSNSAELAMDSHLHFEMIKAGKWIDPTKKITE